MSPAELHARRAWVFDLDGTLTVPVHDFDALRRELGIPPGRYILEHLDTLPPDEAAPVRAHLDAVERELAEQSVAAPGTRDVLAALTERGLPMGILTRNTRDNALVSLAAMGLEDVFDHALVLGRDEAPAKPDPAGILHLLAAWAHAPHEAVMVGDFRLDLESGRAAGTATVLVDSGDRGHLWPELTDLYVPDMAALAQHLAAGQGSVASQASTSSPQSSGSLARK